MRYYFSWQICLVFTRSIKMFSTFYVLMYIFVDNLLKVLIEMNTFTIYQTFWTLLVDEYAVVIAFYWSQQSHRLRTLLKSQSSKASENNLLKPLHRSYTKSHLLVASWNSSPFTQLQTEDLLNTTIDRAYEHDPFQRRSFQNRSLPTF